MIGLTIEVSSFFIRFLSGNLYCIFYIEKKFAIMKKSLVYKRDKVMIRLLIVIILNWMRFIYLLPLMRKMAKNSDKYPEESCYRLARYVVRTLKVTGGIRTKAYGIENLPEEGGYMMYPNHQGKYDVYGIVSVHPKPCTVVIDKDKSYYPFVSELVEMLHAKRLDKNDVRQGLTVIKQVAEEVKEGRRYILFPEGKYVTKNKNTMSEFKNGCFKIALMSQIPIVPVVLVDSYKVFNGFYFAGLAKSQVHFLPPIYYEEYKGLKTHEIADLVKSRIQEKLDEVLAYR